MKTTRLILLLAAALAVGTGTAAPAFGDGGATKPRPGVSHVRPAHPKPVAPAHRHHSSHSGTRYSIGVYLGPGFGWGYRPPYYYPPPYPYYYPAPAYYYPPYPYYPPAVVTVPASPPTYIERGTAEADPGASQSAWWYFCREANGYYPYIKQCPGGWERVTPQPPPER